MCVGSSLSQSEVSPELIAAYRATEYRGGCGPEAIVLRIDERSASLMSLFDSSGYRSAAFITAYNPSSRLESEDANRAAHARLRAALMRRTPHIIEGASANPAGAWPDEKSFLALGLELEEAKAVGREFGQNAIVFADADAIPRLILLR